VAQYFNSVFVPARRCFVCDKRNHEQAICPAQSLRRGDIEYCDRIYIVVIDTRSQKLAARGNFEIAKHRQFRKIRNRRSATIALPSKVRKTALMIRIIIGKGFFIVVACVKSHPSAAMDVRTIITTGPNIV